MQKSYTTLSKYYDLFFQQKDYQAEVGFILELVKRYKVKTEAILDVGCGTGTHLNLLRDKFKVLYGVDLNKEILAVAKAKIKTATFQNTGMTDFKFDRTFNVITCLYSVFNYNRDVESATQTLKNFYRHLTPGGIVIIALYNKRNRDKKTTLDLGESENGKTKVAKFNYYHYVPKEKVIKCDYLALINDNGKIDFDIEKEDTFRIFDFNEIDAMTKKTGFGEYKLYDGFNLGEATEESKYPVLVLRK